MAIEQLDLALDFIRLEDNTLKVKLELLSAQEKMKEEFANIADLFPDSDVNEVGDQVNDNPTTLLDKKKKVLKEEEQRLNQMR